MTIDLATEDDSLVEGPEDYALSITAASRAEHDGCRRGGQRHGVHGDDDDHGQRWRHRHGGRSIDTSSTTTLLSMEIMGQPTRPTSRRLPHTRRLSILRSRPKELGKNALLPGQTATFANYTSYGLGINGIMVDISGLAGTPTAADFTFKVGNDNDPDNWVLAAAPVSVTVFAGMGTGGSDRITIIWADNAIEKEWLQVTVLATAETGLAEADVFYFGNAIGETGDAAANAFVNSTDTVGVRDNPHNFTNPALVYDAYDFNRDGKVNSTDAVLARDNATNFATALKLISVPAAAPAPLAGETALMASDAATPVLAASVSAVGVEDGGEDGSDSEPVLGGGGGGKCGNGRRRRNNPSLPVQRPQRATANPIRL